MFSITIEDKFQYHHSVLFGLDIVGPSRDFPLVVGCSAKNLKGKVLHIKPQWLLSPGRALWSFELGRHSSDFLADEFQTWDEDEIIDDPAVYYAGRIIFALWKVEAPDFTDFAKTSFSTTKKTRLADTGWISFEIISLMETSASGMDYQDKTVESKYGKRKAVWK